jgi:hypothetical protein
VGFGKIVFGTLLAAIGAVLLAERFGQIPSGTAVGLLSFWPVLLVAVGLALLANSLKKAALGWLAALLVLAAVGLGAFWLAKRPVEAAPPEQINLGAARISSLALRGRTLFGSVDLGSNRDGGRSLEIRAAGILGDRRTAYRWIASGSAGIVEWPARVRERVTALAFGGLLVRAPSRSPVRIDAESFFSTARADLRDLRPEDCRISACGSTVRVRSGAGKAPGWISVHGFLSDVEIRLPPHLPARLECDAPVSLVSVSPDFVELARGRAKGFRTVYVAEGRGTPLRMEVGGALLRLRVTRDPTPAL